MAACLGRVAFREILFLGGSGAREANGSKPVRLKVFYYSVPS